MKFLCDVHTPFRLSKHLQKNGHQAEHVNRILNGSKSEDQEIAGYADNNNCIVITKDEDFKNIHFARGCPKKVLRILLGNLPTHKITATIDKHMPELGENEQVR